MLKKLVEIAKVPSVGLLLCLPFPGKNKVNGTRNSTGQARALVNDRTRDGGDEWRKYVVRGEGHVDFRWEE